MYSGVDGILYLNYPYVHEAMAKCGRQNEKKIISFSDAFV